MNIAVGEILGTHVIEMVGSLQLSPVIEQFGVAGLLYHLFYLINLVKGVRLHCVTKPCRKIPFHIRPAAVAGIFYPAQSQVLKRQLDAYLLDSPCQQQHNRRPKVLVVPHAGYKYSASIAASAYHQLQPYGEQIKRVVLLGPAAVNVYHIFGGG